MDSQLKQFEWTDGLVLKSFYNRSMNWYPSDSVTNYKAIGNKYTPQSFNYVFNSNGFRCDSFDNPLDHKFRVLFIGCSITVGIGLPVEETWAHIVKSELEKELGIKIPYWNLAHGGKSPDYAARMLWKFAPILKPHLVVFLTPPGIRTELIINDAEVDFVSGYMDWLGDLIKVEELLKFLSNPAYYYNLNKNLALMQLATEAEGGEFMWNARWSNVSNLRGILDDRAREILSPKFVDAHVDGFFPHVVTDLARDSMHPGPESHKFFADAIKDDVIVRAKAYVARNNIDLGLT